MSSKEDYYLTDYHREMSKAASEEVKDMCRRPLSHTEKLLQAEKIKTQLLKESHRKTR